MFHAIKIVLAIIISSAILLPSVSAQEVSSKHKRYVKTIESMIDKANRLYKSKKYQSSAEKLNDAQKRIQELATVANKDLMDMLSEQHKRIEKAHELLAEEKVKFDPLQPLPDPIVGDGSEVSFTKTIAPILVKNCGRCHVNGSRGQFSAKDYPTLMQSLHVSAGRPDTSRIVEVIADGDMPPNGNVDKKELEQLKSWIRQGAKFDGNNPNANLNQLAGVTNNANNAPRIRLQPTEPKGTETVSFGRDVAPILIESCSGCHINARQLRGDFNMNNFARLLRGGSSGNPFVPGDTEESLILNRLKGINSEIMPPRKKLSDKKIAIIEKWILEGATFDGLEPNSPIATVAAVTKALAQSHKELTADRDKLGVKNWNLIMDDDRPDQIKNEHFRIIGSNRSNRLDSASRMANDLRQQIVEELKTDDDRPFVKGKPTIYMFEKRYDLNELGMMLAGKELPKNQTGRWEYDVIDAYVAVVSSRGKSKGQVKAEMTQQLASVHVASLANDVPRWFADGVGYLTASRINKKDETTKKWMESAQRAISTMEYPFQFTTNKMEEMEAGLAAYLYVKELRGSGKLTKLLKQLNNGSTFKKAFISVFGTTPETYFQPPKPKRRNRRR